MMKSLIALAAAVVLGEFFALCIVSALQLLASRNMPSA